MADFDEELKRQAAISSLLAQEDPGPSEDSYAASMAPVIKPDTQADYHKLINETFDRDPSNAPLRDHPDISPPPPLNIPKPTPESPSGPVDIKTDPDTGTRYVQDPLEGKIPHAELATPSDEAAFKPSDVVLPQIDVSGTGAPVQVKRGEEITEPWHPAGQDLQIPTPTPESPSGPVPPPPKPVPGFVESSKNAILNPAAGVVPAAPRAEIVQDPIVTRSIAKNIADQSAPAPAPAPAPAQTQCSDNASSRYPDPEWTDYSASPSYATRTTIPTNQFRFPSAKAVGRR